MDPLQIPELDALFVSVEARVRQLECECVVARLCSSLTKPPPIAYVWSGQERR